MLPSYGNHKNNIHQNIGDLWVLHLHCNPKGSSFFFPLQKDAENRIRVKKKKKPSEKNPGTKNRALKQHSYGRDFKAMKYELSAANAAFTHS